MENRAEKSTYERSANLELDGDSGTDCGSETDDGSEGWERFSLLVTGNRVDCPPRKTLCGGQPHSFSTDSVMTVFP